MADATGPVGQSDVLSLVARYGNDIVQEQIENAVPITKSNTLKKVPMKGKKAVFNVIAGGLDSSTWIKDNATLPSGSGFVPLQGEQGSAAFLSRITLGHQAMWDLTGADDSADLVEYTLKGAGADLGRQMGRGLFDSSLSPDGYNDGGNAPVAGVYSRVEVQDVSGFREGQAIILFDTSASRTFCLEVTSVVGKAVDGESANVAGEIQLENIVEGIGGISGHADSDLPTIASDDVFYQRGRFDVTGAAGTAVDQSAVCVSFNDIGSATSTLHGLAPAGNAAGYGWKGLTATSFGVLTQEALSGVAMRVLSSSGKRPTHLVMHPAAGVAYQASAVGTSTSFGFTAVGTGRNRAVGVDSDVIGNVLDDYESGLQFMGKPVILEPNCPTAQAVLHNKEAVELGIWKEAGPLKQGGEDLLISQTTFGVDVQIVGAFNLLCRQRRAIAVIKGISDL